MTRRWFVTEPLPLWTRIRLWFKPTYVAIDAPYATFYKTLDGNTYIVGQEKLPQSPTAFQR